MAQSLPPSKPAKPMPRRSQKCPKSVRHSELFAMSAGRPAPPSARTIRQPRRKLVETEKVWTVLNPLSTLKQIRRPTVAPFPWSLPLPFIRRRACPGSALPFRSFFP
jgi:hypothetical protein